MKTICSPYAFFFSSFNHVAFFVICAENYSAWLMMLYSCQCSGQKDWAAPVKLKKMRTNTQQKGWKSAAYSWAQRSLGSHIDLENFICNAVMIWYISPKTAGFLGSETESHINRKQRISHIQLTGRKRETRGVSACGGAAAVVSGTQYWMSSSDWINDHWSYF